MSVVLFLIVAAICIFILIQVAGHWRRKGHAASMRHFFNQVHGITHKNEDGSSRQDIIRQCWVGEELVLVPEPTNRYDPNAVKICRKNGQQLGYWTGDGRMAYDLAIGWTYRVTIDEIYPFKENCSKHGVRLRVEVLTMSRRTEERKKRAAAKAQAAPPQEGYRQ